MISIFMRKSIGECELLVLSFSDCIVGFLPFRFFIVDTFEPTILGQRLLSVQIYTSLWSIEKHTVSCIRACKVKVYNTPIILLACNNF